MIDPSRLISLKTKIIALTFLAQDTLAAVSHDHHVSFVDTQNNTIRDNFEFASLGEDSKQVAFSLDGHYLAYAHDAYVYIVDLQQKQAIHRIHVDIGKINTLCFNSDASYLILGTSEGRVFLYRYNHDEMLSRLASFPEHTHKMMAPLHNYVSALATYHHLVASAGYGDSVVISNTLTSTHPIRIYPGRSRINCIAFIDENTILLANEDGKIVKLCIHENRPHHQVSASIGAIKHLVILSGNTFGLAASEHKNIALINIETMQIIDSHYLSFHENISAIAMGDESLLYIALESGSIYKVKLIPIGSLKMRIENRQFELAYELIEEFPLLKESSWFVDLEKIFSLYYAKALRALLLNDESGAYNHLEMFMRTPSKKKSIQELFYAFHHYERLQYLAKNQRLSALYGLVDEYKALKMTPEFHAIEENWENLFEKAQKLILQGHELEAKTLLQDFNKVSAKAPLIRLILELSTDIITFSKALATQDYKTLHVMTQRYPLLKMMPSYKRIMQETDSLIEQIILALKEDRFEDANASCALLHDVPHLIKHYDHISLFIRKAEHLFHAESQYEFRQCYETLDSFIGLAILPRSKILEARWQKMIQGCEVLAFQGNAGDILKHIKKLMPLVSRQEKLGSLLRLAYMVQLKNLPPEDKRFTYGMQEYEKFFGGDSEIQEILKKRNIHVQMQWLPRNHWLEFYRRLPSFIYEAI
ncbi:MAG: hypothetical protein U9R50_07280 [Campylobacterota bacterium]|nr:hypothetical protein [Campylobacterota bacterium]